MMLGLGGYPQQVPVAVAPLAYPYTDYIQTLFNRRDSTAVLCLGVPALCNVLGVPPTGTTVLGIWVVRIHSGTRRELAKYAKIA